MHASSAADHHTRARRWLTALVLPLSLLLLPVGCGWGAATERDRQGAQAAATRLSDALAQGDLHSVVFSGLPAAAAESARRTLVRGMGPIRPHVMVQGVETLRETAEARLRYSWTFPGVPRVWSYEVTAELRQENQGWATVWSPTLVHPDLSDASRLSQRRRYPPRGDILGENGEPLVVERPVVRYGIDKSAITAPQAAVAARRLASLLHLNQDAYLNKVEQAGPQSFVEALVLRATADERPDNSDVTSIKGALAIETTRMLAPSRTFARALLGTVGEATKDIVDAAGGTVVAGDQVGLSGLQRRYNQQLRGVPGVQVDLLVATPPTPSPARSDHQGVPNDSSPRPAERRTLFEADAVLGTDLTITLNAFLQKRAERILADVKPASALVAIRPSTGAVVVAANGPGANDQSVATVGQAAPGSTFKIVTSLALLRAGLTPDTRVSCPRRLTVDGRTFTNYSDYPSQALGKITLQEALAHSCNTAFIGQRQRVSGDALSQAAGSLGLGQDYAVGYASYFGEVPNEPTGTALAAATIGQGTVLASPLAMAAVIASVQAGHTVVPHLVEGVDTASSAEPLTPVEARQLQSMLRSVVTSGSATALSDLPGPPVLAKTGTAEYGARPPYSTHAWMVAAHEDLAVAVYVHDGASGSRTAGPLIERFLRAAR